MLKVIKEEKNRLSKLFNKISQCQKELTNPRKNVVKKDTVFWKECPLLEVNGLLQLEEERGEKN